MNLKLEMNIKGIGGKKEIEVKYNCFKEGVKMKIF